MKLFYSPGACSLAARIALHEAGVEFQSEKVDLKTKTTASGQEFIGINPKGYVPALQLLDGQVLTENQAILQYIADRKPQANLAPPAGTIERYQLQEWLGFIGTELHKSFSPLFKPTTPEDYKKVARATIESRLMYVEQRLAGHQCLMGQQFTVADAYLFTVLRWTVPMKIVLDAYPKLRDYIMHSAARPAVQRALEEEGLSQ